MAARRSERLSEKAVVNYTDFTDIVCVEEREKKRKMNAREKDRLYPVEIVARDRINDKIKVHYVGYPSSMDEWKDCTKQEERICALKQRPIPKEISCDDRFSVFLHEVYTGIKQNLVSLKRDDPLIKFEVSADMDIQQLMEDKGKKTEKRGQVIYEVVENQQLDPVFGIGWDRRVLNKEIDFCYVVDGSLRFWFKQPAPIKDFQMIGGVPIETQIERTPCIVFSFVRGDGTRDSFAGNCWRKSS